MTAPRVRFLKSIADIDAASWNALTGCEQPFVRHEFLLALEASGCASPRTGWTAQHIVLEDSDGRAIGAMPRSTTAVKIAPWLAGWPATAQAIANTITSSATHWSCGQ